MKSAIALFEQGGASTPPRTSLPSRLHTNASPLSPDVGAARRWQAPVSGRGSTSSESSGSSWHQLSPAPAVTAKSVEVHFKQGGSPTKNGSLSSADDVKLKKGKFVNVSSPVNDKPWRAAVNSALFNRTGSNATSNSETEKNPFGLKPVKTREANASSASESSLQDDRSSLSSVGRVDSWLGNGPKSTLEAAKSRDTAPANHKSTVNVKAKSAVSAFPSSPVGLQDSHRALKSLETTTLQTSALSPTQHLSSSIDDPTVKPSSLFANKKKSKANDVKIRVCDVQMAVDDVTRQLNATNQTARLWEEEPRSDDTDSVINVSRASKADHKNNNTPSRGVGNHFESKTINVREVIKPRKSNALSSSKRALVPSRPSASQHGKDPNLKVLSVSSAAGEVLVRDGWGRRYRLLPVPALAGGRAPKKYAQPPLVDLREFITGT